MKFPILPAAPLLDEEDLAPPGGAVGGAKRITCEFCECGLATSGEVLKRSARAKELLALEETNETLRGELEAARAETAEVQQQLDAARGELATMKKKGQSLFS